MENSKEDGIHKRITEQRQKKGLNQAQLAAQAEITPAALSQIEKGDRTPSLPVLRRLADALGVSIDFLAGRSKASNFEDVLMHEGTRSFFQGFRDLSSEDQSTILKNIDFLRAQAEMAKKNSKG